MTDDRLREWKRRIHDWRSRDPLPITSAEWDELAEAFPRGIWSCKINGQTAYAFASKPGIPLFAQWFTER